MGDGVDLDAGGLAHAHVQGGQFGVLGGAAGEDDRGVAGRALVGAQLVQCTRGAAAGGRGGVGVHLVQAVQDRQHPVAVHQVPGVGEGDAPVAELVVDLVGEPVVKWAGDVPAGQEEPDRDGIGVGTVGVGEQAEQQVEGEQGLAGAGFAGDDQPGRAQLLVVADDAGQVALRIGAVRVVGGLLPVGEGQVDAMGTGADQLGALRGLGGGHSCGQGGCQGPGPGVGVRRGVGAVVAVGGPGQVGPGQGGGHGDDSAGQTGHLELLGQPQCQRRGHDLKNCVDDGCPAGPRSLHGRHASALTRRRRTDTAFGAGL